MVNEKLIIPPPENGWPPSSRVTVRMLEGFVQSPGSPNHVNEETILAIFTTGDPNRSTRRPTRAPNRPPQIEKVAPKKNAKACEPTQPVTVSFRDPVQAGSGRLLITAEPLDGSKRPSSRRVKPDSDAITFANDTVAIEPRGGWPPAARITLTMQPDFVQAGSPENGNEEVVIATFTTAADPPGRPGGLAPSTRVPSRPSLNIPDSNNPSGQSNGPDDSPRGGSRSPRSKSPRGGSKSPRGSGTPGLARKRSRGTGRSGINAEKVVPRNETTEWDRTKPVTVTFPELIAPGSGTLEILTEPVRGGRPTAKRWKANSDQLQFVNDKVVINPRGGWKANSRITVKMWDGFVQARDSPDKTNPEVILTSFTTGADNGRLSRRRSSSRRRNRPPKVQKVTPSKSSGHWDPSLPLTITFKDSVQPGDGGRLQVLSEPLDERSVPSARRIRSDADEVTVANDTVIVAPPDGWPPHSKITLTMKKGFVFSETPDDVNEEAVLGTFVTGGTTPNNGDEKEADGTQTSDPNGNGAGGASGRPRVLSSTPAADVEKWDPERPVTVCFSRPVDAGTAPVEIVIEPLSGDGDPVVLTRDPDADEITVAGDRVVFKPETQWPPASRITVRIPEGFVSAGSPDNTNEPAVITTFTTADSCDDATPVGTNAAPQVETVSPLDSSENCDVSTPAVVVFGGCVEPGNGNGDPSGDNPARNGSLGDGTSADDPSGDPSGNGPVGNGEIRNGGPSSGVSPDDPSSGAMRITVEPLDGSSPPTVRRVPPSADEVNVANELVIFKPVDGWPPLSRVTLTMEPGFVSDNGNPNPEVVLATFTTGPKDSEGGKASSDNPQVDKVTPPDATSDWNPEQPMTISFSEPVVPGETCLQVVAEPLDDVGGDPSARLIAPDSDEVKFANDKVVVQPGEGWPPLSRIIIKMPEGFACAEKSPDKKNDETILATFTTGEPSRVLSRRPSQRHKQGKPEVEGVTPDSKCDSWLPSNPVTVGFKDCVEPGHGRLQVLTQPLDGTQPTTRTIEPDSEDALIANDVVILEPRAGWPPLSKITLTMGQDFVQGGDANGNEETPLGSFVTGPGDIAPGMGLGDEKKEREPMVEAKATEEDDEESVNATTPRSITGFSDIFADTSEPIGDEEQRGSSFVNPEHEAMRDSFKDNNAEWRNAVESSRAAAQAKEVVEDVLLEELKGRVRDMQRMMRILSGEDKKKKPASDPDGHTIFVGENKENEDADANPVEKLVGDVADRHHQALVKMQKKLNNPDAAEKQSGDSGGMSNGRSSNGPKSNGYEHEEKMLESHGRHWSLADGITPKPIADDSSSDESDSDDGFGQVVTIPPEWRRMLSDIRDNNDAWRSELRQGQQLEERQVQAVQEALENSGRRWWLRRDEDRNKVVDGVHTENMEELLGVVAVYLNRVLPLTSGLPKAIHDLYVPIIFDRPIGEVGSVPHNIVATLYDGVLFSALVNSIFPDHMDLRGMHLPDLSDPYPLSDHQIRENMRAILSIAKSLGLKLRENWTLDDYMNGGQTGVIIADLMIQLASCKIDEMVNLKRCPQLVNLATPEEAKDDTGSGLNHVSGEEWLKRWFNDKLQRDADNDFDPRTFLADTCQLIEKVAPPNSFAGDSVANMTDVEQQLQIIFDFIMSDLHVDLTADPRDILECSLLQVLLFAEVFGENHALPPLAKDTKKKITRILSQDSSETKPILAWIRSLGGEFSNIRYIDVSDGLLLLRLVDAAKPGSVDWRQAREEIRHKFDKVNNCNLAVNLCKENLGLKLIGIAGTDLVEGNQKYIHIILWEIMKYHATRILSQLSFDGNTVSDEDILRWCNAEIIKLGEERRSNKPEGIVSLKDKELSTCIYYLDLINASGRRVVDWNMVNNVPPRQAKTRSRKPDEYHLERMSNARYVLTLIRRMGGELFVAPNDIVQLEPRAVVSVLTSIMTINSLIASDPTYLSSPKASTGGRKRTRKSNAFLFGTHKKANSLSRSTTSMNPIPENGQTNTLTLPGSSGSFVFHSDS